jgi:hypothetical protein
MSLRATYVDELSTWCDGALQSNKQKDEHSCGLYVMLVGKFQCAYPSIMRDVDDFFNG